MSDFYITLPSNVGGAENKTSDFRTRLPEPILFRNNWSVGLHEILISGEILTVPRNVPFVITLRDGGGTINCHLPKGTYKTPQALATALNNAVPRTRKRRNVQQPLEEEEIPYLDEDEERQLTDIGDPNWTAEEWAEHFARKAAATGNPATNEPTLHPKDVDKKVLPTDYPPPSSKSKEEEAAEIESKRKKELELKAAAEAVRLAEEKKKQEEMRKIEKAKQDEKKRRDDEEERLKKKKEEEERNRKEDEYRTAADAKKRQEEEEEKKRKAEEYRTVVEARKRQEEEEKKRQEQARLEHERIEKQKKEDENKKTEAKRRKNMAEAERKRKENEERISKEKEAVARKKKEEDELRAKEQKEKKEAEDKRKEAERKKKEEQARKDAEEARKRAAAEEAEKSRLKALEDARLERLNQAEEQSQSGPIVTIDEQEEHLLSTSFATSQLPTHIVFIYDEKSGKMIVNLNYNVQQVDFSDDISYMCGFSQHTLYDSAIGEHSPDCTNGKSLLYVYSDICAFSVCGTQKTNLLRVIPCMNAQNDTVSQSFQQIRYIGVRSEYVDSIRIQILDSLGNEVVIQGYICVVLHITKNA